jgi:hypothetical protein
MPMDGGVFKLRREGGVLDEDEREGEKGGLLEFFEEREGLSEMKGERKGRVESRRREMKEGEKGRARGRR